MPKDNYTSLSPLYKVPSPSFLSPSPPSLHPLFLVIKVSTVFYVSSKSSMMKHDCPDTSYGQSVWLVLSPLYKVSPPSLLSFFLVIKVPTVFYVPSKSSMMKYDCPDTSCGQFVWLVLSPLYKVSPHPFHPPSPLPPLLLSCYQSAHGLLCAVEE